MQWRIEIVMGLITKNPLLVISVGNAVSSVAIGILSLIQPSGTMTLLFSLAWLIGGGSGYAGMPVSV